MHKFCFDNFFRYFLKMFFFFSVTLFPSDHATLSLASSAQVERENESWFFVLAAAVRSHTNLKLYKLCQKMVLDVFMFILSQSHIYLCIFLSN